MQYVVINNFRDLQDDRYFYDVGKEYPREGFESTDERTVFLIEKGYIQEKEVVEQEVVENLNAMNKAQLIELAKKRKVSVDSKMTKAELIDLLK